MSPTRFSRNTTFVSLRCKAPCVIGSSCSLQDVLVSRFFGAVSKEIARRQSTALGTVLQTQPCLVIFSPRGVAALRCRLPPDPAVSLNGRLVIELLVVLILGQRFSINLGVAMRVSLAQVKAITNRTVSQAFCVLVTLLSVRYASSCCSSTQMDLELLRLRGPTVHRFP